MCLGAQVHGRENVGWGSAEQVQRGEGILVGLGVAVRTLQ